MNEIVTTGQSLPDTIPDLAKFVLIGRDKLKAVRAEIHAIDKVGMAREVYQQKLEEAQEIAEVVTDAECRMGELLKTSVKVGNPQLSSASDNCKLSDVGITRNQSSQFQLMANHPNSVEKAKAKARQQGTVLSRNAVLNQIISDTKPKNPVREMEQEAEKRHESFDTSAKTISFGDIQQDREDRKTIGNRAYIQIGNTIKTLSAYTLFKQESVRAIPDALDSVTLQHFEVMIKDAIASLNQILDLLEGNT